MKLAAIGILCLLCFSVSAQDQPDSRHYLACATAPTHLGKCWGDTGYNSPSFLATHPERGIAPDFAFRARVGDPSPGDNGHPISVTLAASAIQSSKTAPVVWSLRGNVEIHTATMVLEADEADYQRTTGEIEAHGNVRVKLIPPR